VAARTSLGERKESRGSDGEERERAGEGVRGWWLGPGGSGTLACGAMVRGLTSGPRRRERLPGGPGPMKKSKFELFSNLY
jgi:hypothetical protein